VVWATDNAGEQVSQALNETSNTLPASAITSHRRLPNWDGTLRRGPCTDI
jgi:hypothetical protein